MSTDDLFLRESVSYLRDTYVPRLARALEILPAGDLWWRPDGGSLAFGTILLHLEGNARQWILSGIGAEPDRRDRAAEFAAREGPSGAELLARLTDTVRAACAVIESLDAAKLAVRHRIQGQDVSALEAVYHVVEHFSWHTGQAVWVAKARAGAGHELAFYDEARVNAARNG